MSVFFFFFFLSSAMTSKQCAHCCDSVSDDSRYMECCVCASLYHLGPECSGIAEATFGSMGPNRREKWRCRACRPGNSSQTDTELASSQLEAINEKLAKLDTFIVTVESLSQVMLGLKPEIGAVKAIVQEVQSSVNTLSQKYDCLAADCDAR